MLSENVLISSCLDYVSAATSRNGAVVDMAEYDGCLIIVKMAAIASTAVTSLKAQQGAASDMSDAQDLTGTSITIADDDDDEIFALDIYQPRERYIRAVMSKATAAAAESAVYLRYRSKTGPITQGSGVTLERHASPAEGTA